MCCGASYGPAVNYGTPGDASPYTIGRGTGPRVWEVTMRGTGERQYAKSEAEVQTLTASGGGVRELSPSEITALRASGAIT